MVDNFKQIESLLEFPSKDSFYFTQCIYRRKEHPDAENNNTKLRSWYIRSREELNKKKEEIIKFCEYFQARAYINLNPRSFEGVGKAALVHVADYIQKGDYEGIKAAYDTACGRYKTKGDLRRWLVDIDTKEKEEVEAICDYIEKLQAEIPHNKYQIISLVPTKNGYHVITNPFNTQKFVERYPKVDYHPNNPTILYVS
jgi:hypothetical protein